MEVNILKTKTKLDVAVKGSLDVNTSPEFEEKLMPRLEGIDRLIFDFSGLDYISSAGLRVILSALQILDARGGTMVINHASENIKKVFKLTGFLSIIDFR